MRPGKSSPLPFPVPAAADTGAHLPPTMGLSISDNGPQFRGRWAPVSAMMGPGFGSSRPLRFQPFSPLSATGRAGIAHGQGRPGLRRTQKAGISSRTCRLVLHHLIIDSLCLRAKPKTEAPCRRRESGESGARSRGLPALLRYSSMPAHILSFQPFSAE